MRQGFKKKKTGGAQSITIVKPCPLGVSGQTPPDSCRRLQTPPLCGQSGSHSNALCTPNFGCLRGVCRSLPVERRSGRASGGCLGEFLGVWVGFVSVWMHVAGVWGPSAGVWNLAAGLWIWLQVPGSICRHLQIRPDTCKPPKMGASKNHQKVQHLAETMSTPKPLATFSPVWSVSGRLWPTNDTPRPPSPS